MHDSKWLAGAYDELLDISRMEKMLELAEERAHSRKPITHFDRSTMRAAGTKGARESTIFVAPFLKESLRGMKEYMGYLLRIEERSTVSQIAALH
jgi:hypothetical protein